MSIRLTDRIVVILLVMAGACLLWAGSTGFTTISKAIVAPRATFDPDASHDGNYLHGGSFKGSYASMDDGGVIAEGWTDQSHGDDAPVKYARDETASRTQSLCQRVDIPAGGQWQMEQYRVLPWGRYRATFWMRSNDKIPVTVSVRGGPHWDAYLIDKVLVRNQWKRYELSGFVSNWGQCTITLGSTRPGTLWLQDSRLEMTGGGFAGVFGIVVFIIAASAALFFLGRYCVTSGLVAEALAWARRNPSKRTFTVKSRSSVARKH